MCKKQRIKNIRLAYQIVYHQTIVSSDLLFNMIRPVFAATLVTAALYKSISKSSPSQTNCRTGIQTGNCNCNCNCNYNYNKSSMFTVLFIYCIFITLTIFMNFYLLSCVLFSCRVNSFPHTVLQMLNNILWLLVHQQKYPTTVLANFIFSTWMQSLCKRRIHEPFGIFWHFQS
jgi:hypothetical protein